MNRDELVRYLDEVLESTKFDDYSPNGLQVEGVATIRHIVTGVTACQALLDEAVRRGADTVLVHHGYFWKGENPRVVGMRRQRLKTLLQNEMNLIGYHLPLDAHPEWGNNAGWARAMGWQVEGYFGAQGLGVWGRPTGEMTLGQLTSMLARVLGRVPLLIGDPERPVDRLAWCSGGAQSYMEAAAALGVTVFLSGEVSEQTTHIARETGVAYLACGHHATERFGVQALAERLNGLEGMRCEFVDIDNPV